VNHLFFDPPWNKLKTRVIGLFLADGYVHKRHNHLSLSQADPAPLRMILKLMKCGAKIQRKSGRKEWVIDIYNGRLVDRLSEMGFDNRKTYTAAIPSEIPLKLFPELIGGIHEGDGSVFLEINKLYPHRICGGRAVSQDETCLERYPQLPDLSRHITGLILVAALTIPATISRHRGSWRLTGLLGLRILL
jgi:hypothetical protein